jgi:hypothetical protein
MIRTSTDFKIRRMRYSPVEKEMRFSKENFKWNTSLEILPRKTRFE